jgi:hypothetical protein
LPVNKFKYVLVDIYYNKNLLEIPKLIVIKMKKKEIFAISLLSILLFVSVANVSVAAPPSYVGIKNGDTYIWTANLNVANLNATAIALFGEDNWTYMYEYFMEYYENNTGMEFQNVTDEIYPFLPGVNASGVFFDYYVAYAANNWTLVSNATTYPFPMIYFIDPSVLNESTIMYGMMGTPLFMSKGFNYTMFVDVYQAMIASIPELNGNVTIQVHGNGFKITYKAVYLEYMFNMTGVPFEIGTLSDADMIITWNSNGVLNYASLAYGGLTLATAQLVTTDDGFIPGYELVTILGVSVTTILAIIYMKRKKNI